MTNFYSTITINLTRHYTLLLRIFVLLLTLSLFNTAHAQWTRKADEILKRAEGNNVVYQGKLYVFGGFGDNPIIEPTNEVYDIAADKWTNIAPFPKGKEITHQGVVLVDNKVWHIGGRAVDAYGPVSSQVIIYDIATNTWTNGPELIDPATRKAFPIGGGGYALVGRTLHVFGGFGPVICEDQSTLHLTINVDKYMASPSTVTWENKLAPMPEPRNHISYVTLGGKIYALGGQFKHDCLALDQPICHVYDPTADTWTRLTDLPIVRSHAEASTFAVDGKIFLAAGQGVNNKTQNTVYQFNPEDNKGTGSWTNLSAYKLPGSFLGLSAKLAGNNFIVTNGALDSYANERRETYIAQISRASSRTLGFTESCFSQNLAPGEKSSVKNLLYVIEDAVNYTTSSNASWLSVTSNARGSVNLSGNEIEVSVNTAGLEPGSYNGTITATESQKGTSTTFCVNLEVTDDASLTSLRINAGGPAVNASGNRAFIADRYFSGVDRTGNPYSGAIANTSDDVLYQTERSSEQFSYNVPVENGSMNVVLHFAEIWYGVPGRAAGGAGKRMFNVDMEGIRKLTDYDIFAEAGGAMTAVQETFAVNVTDGMLNINFTAGKANLPKISAIEIIPQDIPNTAPVLAVIGNKNVTLGQTLQFSASATDDDNTSLTFTLSGAPSGAVMDSGSGAFTWTPAAAGTFTFTVRVSDNGNPSMSDEQQLTITVSGPAQTNAIRINAGGNTFTASDGRVFSADAYFDGTDRVSSLSSGDILNTQDDALYRTERSAEAFGYRIPVANGTVTVTLHFAEIWFGIADRGKGGEGSRQFQVDMEGARKLTNFDIFDAAGGSLRAIQRTFQVNVTDGQLDIDFRSGDANLPCIAAIEVQPQNAQPSASVTLTPVADAFVRNGNFANTNYGMEASLYVKSGGGSGYDRNSYLKFALGSLGQVVSAKLRIYGKNVESSEKISLNVYAVENDSWTENGITWNNAPASSTTLGTVAVDNAYKYYEVDITQYVRAQQAGDKSVSLQIKNSLAQNKSVSIYSKDRGIYPPQLIIETTGSAMLARIAAPEMDENLQATDAQISYVYPNPVQSTFYVQFSEKHHGPVDMQLINTAGNEYPLGTIVNPKSNVAQKVTLPDTRLTQGIYLLKMNSAAYSETIKLILAE